MPLSIPLVAAAFLAGVSWNDAQPSADLNRPHAPEARGPLIRIDGPMTGGRSGGGIGGGVGPAIGAGLGAGLLGGALSGATGYNSNLPYNGAPPPPPDYNPQPGTPQYTNAFYDPSSGQYYPNSDSFVRAHLTGTEQPGEVFYGTDGNLYADGYNYRQYHPPGARPGDPVTITGTPGVDHGAFFWDPNRGNQQTQVVSVGGRLLAPGSVGPDGKLDGGFYDPPTHSQVSPTLPPAPAQAAAPGRGPTPMSPAERAGLQRGR